MSFALLAPAALALGILVLGPVLAHLAKRHPREERAYGAVMLLERLQRRLQRRRRLQDVLLLLLRALALALVVLAAARPELRRVEGPSSIGGSGKVVVILDNSLSMDQRDGGDPVFALARRDAAEAVRALPSGVLVAAITAGGTAATLTPALTTDAPLAASLLEAVEPGNGGTDLRGALSLARTLLEGAPGEILLYTDESGPGVVEACALDLERLLELGSAVVPRVYGPRERRNVVPAEASYGDGIEGGTVTVKLVNYGDAAREVPTTVYLPDGAQMTAFVEVPGADADAPGTVEEHFTVPRQAEGGVARVEIDDPDLTLDNARWFHLPRVGASRVLVVDGDPGSTPTRSEVYFLERALAPWGAGGPMVDVVSPSAIGDIDPEKHRVVFLANVADPGPHAPRLVHFVRSGGGLVLAMGDNVTADRYNGPLGSILPAPLRKVRDLVDLDASEGTSLRAPELDGPELFRPFARVADVAFPRVRSRRVMTTEPFAESDEVRVLLRYADGTPALVERRIGNGRVLLWTGTFDLGWGNLPLQAVFSPMMQRMVGYLGGDVGPAAATSAGVVGETVRLAVPPAVTEPEVVGPDGGLVGAEREIGALTFAPTAPGAYAARAASGPVAAWVAVNTPLPESDVRRGASLVATQAKIAPERMTQRTPLWLPSMGAALWLLLVAGVVGRGRNPDA